MHKISPLEYNTFFPTARPEAGPGAFCQYRCGNSVISLH